MCWWIFTLIRKSSGKSIEAVFLDFFYMEQMNLSSRIKADKQIVISENAVKVMCAQQVPFKFFNALHLHV